MAWRELQLLKPVRLVFALPLFLLLFSHAVLARHENDAPQLRILSNSFVLPAKFARLAAWAEEAGVALRNVNVENAAGSPADWLKDADLVILDVPRPNDLAMVQQRLGDALAQSGKPWLRVGGGPPAFEHVPPQHARRMIAYYANGGEGNLRALLAYIHAWNRGGDTAGLPQAKALPKAGYYHPAAQQAFDDLQAYLAWGKQRWKKDAPVAAFAIHVSALANMQTALIDAIAVAAEARGLAPLIFWFDAGDPQALTKAIAEAGPVALVNLQHMQNGTARSAEFLSLGIPVIQGLSTREGDIQTWRDSSIGLPPHMVAPFLSVAENWGMSDPLVLDAIQNGEPAPIPEQVELLVQKLAALARLRELPPQEKRLALMFWNYPAGEKNLSASHLNVPRSVENITAALAAAGYAVPAASEADVIAAGQAMLAGYYRPEEALDALLAESKVGLLPLEQYSAWFDTLPAHVQVGIVNHWGEPDRHWALRDINGRKHFVFPLWRLGNLVMLPQPPRSGRPGHAYHDTKEQPDHIYMAVYLYLQQNFAADALVHLGMHGTQEWTPGKDRGLWAGDIPFLTLGAMPVFYPYIQDNIGEALQAKRRGRAVTISHQTPAFAPAGLYAELSDIHGLLHEYIQLSDGATRERTAAELLGLAVKSNLHADIGWSQERAEADFDGFLNALHDHLHELARAAMPLALHHFGQPAAPEHRLSTVLQQLGDPFYRLLGLEPDEVFAGDFSQLQQTRPYRELQRYLREGTALQEVADPALREMLERGIVLDRDLADTQEIEALLAGLAGKFVAPGSGGDPIRNPGMRSGRNLYAFEPDKIPTQAAYAAGGEAFQSMLETYRAEHDGQTPDKLAFSLWSSEALRHLGVLESQVLHALGLRPVWDRGGRVVALDIIPAAELGRPRMDVVLQVTSVYRDQFDGFMRLLAGAIEQLARQDEAGNPVAGNSRKLAEQLIAGGMAQDRAWGLASLRLFSNEAGDYGSGLPEAVLQSTQWENDAPLARQFLNRLQYAYGSRDWGVRVSDANLFEAQLRGVKVAMLSRSSRLHGMLSTDHPFEYLGGLALAVRHLDGASPALYVADLRDSKHRITTAGRFIADEMRTRYLNPHWISTMQTEGYAGTLEILNAVNNLWGWQATAPETVRADQWQAIHDTFVRDIRQLNMQEWFEQHNPTAQLQVIERLIEAIRKDYWQADAKTRQELAERFDQLAQLADVRAASVPQITRDYIAQINAGFDLAPGQGEEAAQPQDSAAQQQIVQGQVMQQVEATQTDQDIWRVMLGLIAIGFFMAAGAYWQFYNNRKAIRLS